MPYPPPPPPLIPLSGPRICMERHFVAKLDATETIVLWSAGGPEKLINSFQGILPAPAFHCNNLVGADPTSMPSAPEGPESGAFASHTDETRQDAHPANSEDGWIDPEWLEDKFDDCVCSSCFSVMFEPVSGCPEGHSFCRRCYMKMLEHKRECPTCRHPVEDEKRLVRNRPLEGVIAELRVRCMHAPEESGNNFKGQFFGSRAADLALESAFANLAVADAKQRVRKAAREGLGGCQWRGKVAELSAHLESCCWTQVKCPRAWCGMLLLRKDWEEHEAACWRSRVPCRHCGRDVDGGALVEHEARCQWTHAERPGRLRCYALQQGRTARAFPRGRAENEGLELETVHASSGAQPLAPRRARAPQDKWVLVRVKSKSRRRRDRMRQDDVALDITTSALPVPLGSDEVRASGGGSWEVA